MIVLSSHRAAAFGPPVPELVEHAFSIDQIDEAAAFEAHLRGLAARPESAARNTAVVVGVGFTGIEIATELGAGPRPVIIEALALQGVECRLGTSVTKIDAGGVWTTAGDRIESLSVLWTGGMRASGLTRFLPGETDGLGRLRVERTLLLPEAPEVFAAGDVACAVTDDDGNHSLMSCQHALMLGRFAGHNAAADLIGADLLPYRQEYYVTCLDLGSSGAVVTNGWGRTIELTGTAAKERKRFINGVLIAPPPADPGKGAGRRRSLRSCGESGEN